MCQKDGITLYDADPSTRSVIPCREHPFFGIITKFFDLQIKALTTPTPSLKVPLPGPKITKIITYRILFILVISYIRFVIIIEI